MLLPHILGSMLKKFQNCIAVFAFLLVGHSVEKIFNALFIGGGFVFWHHNLHIGNRAHIMFRTHHPLYDKRSILSSILQPG
jgi:hypothetical protein